MGNCSGIHNNIHPKSSIIDVQNCFKSINPKPFKLTTMLCQKTQPSLFDYDDHDYIKNRTILDKNGKVIGTSKDLQIFSSVKFLY